MKEHINNVTHWLKAQKLKGCITGSCMLNQYFDGMDVDWFAYNKQSFTQMFYAMWYNPEFQILDKLELWKAEKFMNQDNDFYKTGVQTIKFYYNTCIEINIILKKNANNIFSVLSSFDMDLVTVGYDTYLEQKLDLSGDSHKTKIVNVNQWNPQFLNHEAWAISRILRQLGRVFKYHKRGFNTDNIVHKYIELINIMQEHQDIFKSSSYSEGLKIRKKNTKIVKQLCEVWLQTHEITEEQIKVINEKIKEI